MDLEKAMSFWIFLVFTCFYFVESTSVEKVVLEGGSKDYIDLRTIARYILRCAVRESYEDPMQMIDWYKDGIRVYNWKAGSSSSQAYLDLSGKVETNQNPNLQNLHFIPSAVKHDLMGIYECYVLSKNQETKSKPFHLVVVDISSSDFTSQVSLKSEIIEIQPLNSSNARNNSGINNYHSYNSHNNPNYQFDNPPSYNNRPGYSIDNNNEFTDNNNNRPGYSLNNNNGFNDNNNRRNYSNSYSNTYNDFAQPDRNNYDYNNKPYYNNRSSNHNYDYNNQDYNNELYGNKHQNYNYNNNMFNNYKKNISYGDNCTVAWSFKTPIIFPRPNVTCGYYSYVVDDIVEAFPAGLAMHRMLNGSYFAEFEHILIPIIDIPREHRLACSVSISNTSYKKIIKYEDNIEIDYSIDSEGCESEFFKDENLIKYSYKDGSVNCRGQLVPESNNKPLVATFTCREGALAVFKNNSFSPDWEDTMVCGKADLTWRYETKRSDGVFRGKYDTVVNLEKDVPVCVPLTSAGVSITKYFAFTIGKLLLGWILGRFLF